MKCGTFFPGSLPYFEFYINNMCNIDHMVNKSERPVKKKRKKDHMVSINLKLDKQEDFV